MSGSVSAPWASRRWVSAASRSLRRSRTTSASSRQASRSSRPVASSGSQTSASPGSPMRMIPTRRRSTPPSPPAGRGSAASRSVRITSGSMSAGTSSGRNQTWHPGPRSISAHHRPAASSSARINTVAVGGEFMGSIISGKRKAGKRGNAPALRAGGGMESGGTWRKL